jgi:hypothetical protein
VDGLECIDAEAAYGWQEGDGNGPAALDDGWNVKGFMVVKKEGGCTWMISRMLPQEDDWYLEECHKIDVWETKRFRSRAAYTRTPSTPSSHPPANLLKKRLRSCKKCYGLGVSVQ